MQIISPVVFSLTYTFYVYLANVWHLINYFFIFKRHSLSFHGTFNLDHADDIYTAFAHHPGLERRYFVLIYV